MNCARNYENALNFVKVMPKILLVPFFLDTVYLGAFEQFWHDLYSLLVSYRFQEESNRDRQNGVVAEPQLLKLKFINDAA